jgi:hypothetical protein
MATTSRLRTSYPELVPDPAKPRCDYSTTIPVEFLASGPNYPAGRVTLRVHPATRQLWRALAAVMLFYGYGFAETAGGTLSCRFIGGTSKTSLHAHGIAGDWNPSKNRFRVLGGLIQWLRHTDMPRAMVRAIEAIRMTNGLAGFEWGGRWLNVKDPMHYEVDQLQTKLAPVNLATLPAGSWSAYLVFEKQNPTTEDQVLDRNSPKPSKSVADYQAAMVGLGYDLGDFTPYAPGYPKGADGYFGALAEAGTKGFQKAQDLTVTGKGDALTVTLALSLAGGPGGGDHPDSDHAGLATKAALSSHAKARASTALHPHGHDEGVTGPAK